MDCLFEPETASRVRKILGLTRQRYVLETASSFDHDAVTDGKLLRVRGI